MISSVIFDIDGTLVDSVDLHARAWQEAFRHFGHEISFEEVRHQIGKGSDKLVPHFLSPKEVERLGKDLDEFRGNLWKTKYLHQVRAFPKVRELVERLLADKKKIILASSAKGDELETYKKIAGIDDLIKKETSSDDVEKSKPSPDIIEAALKKLHQSDPSSAIMIGDTPWDALAAGKAGVHTLGMLCGGFPEQELRDAGCLAIYRDPADLLQQYDSSPIHATASKAA